MKNIYFKGSKRTKILTMDNNEKKYIYHNTKNDKELFELLKAAKFEQVLMKHIDSEGLRCYCQGYEDGELWYLDPHEYLKAIIKKEQTK